MFEKGTPAPASTQAHLPLAGIARGVIIMRDGSYRAIIRVGATNFMLKSEQEQEALVYAYQNFLNALNYPIQIIMQSRNLDLEPYLKKIETKIIAQRNELIKQQTEDYVAYVRELIQVANIMDKQFYVVVPYTPLAVAKRGLLAGLLPARLPQSLSVDEQQFQTHREELLQRTSVVAGGLSSLGLKVTTLDTDDLIKLLYGVYNYDIAAEERLNNPAELASEVVSVEDKSTDQAQNTEMTNTQLPIAKEDQSS